MDGMGFLLNSLGINPDELKNAAGQVQVVANDFKASFSRIERKLDFLAPSLLEGEELQRYYGIGREAENESGIGSESGGHPGA